MRSPVDLIRNHVLEFFYGEKVQLDVYNSYWKPLEDEDIDKVEQFFIDQLKLRVSKRYSKGFLAEIPFLTMVFGHGYKYEIGRL